MHRVGSTIMLGLVFALAGAAQAEVKEATASGFTVENHATVPAAPERVWQALVGEIDHWWPKDHSWWGQASELSIEPRAGGCFCEKAGDRQAMHMQVAFVDPGKTLRLLGGLGPMQGMGLHGVMEWRLQPEGDATRITLFYRTGGYVPEDLSTFAPVVDKVQAQQLGGLVRWLAQP